MVKKTMVLDSVKKEPANMNTISVYGLLPTSEFQAVKCCAEVKPFVSVFIKLHFIKKNTNEFFLFYLILGFIQKSAKSFQCTSHKKYA